MSLADWERNGWLTPHRTSRQEISELLAIVQRDLHDSRARDVSADWRFNIAYNAALQAAKAALAASGYRVARGADSHHRTSRAWRTRSDSTRSSVRRLGVFRKRRNTAEYDHAGVTSEAEADEMRALARPAQQVIAWLSSKSSRSVTTAQVGQRPFSMRISSAAAASAASAVEHQRRVEHQLGT